MGTHSINTQHDRKEAKTATVRKGQNVLRHVHSGPVVQKQSYGLPRLKSEINVLIFSLK